MAGHAQLKLVMTECSKTQIRLTRPKWSIISVAFKVADLFWEQFPAIHFSRSTTKQAKRLVCPTKSRISWSESSLSAWRMYGSLATHEAHNKDSVTWQKSRLIWVFAGRTGHFSGFVVLWLFWLNSVLIKIYTCASLLTGNIYFSFPISGLAYIITSWNKIYINETLDLRLVYFHSFSI